MESAGKRQKTQHINPNEIIEESKDQTVIIQFKDSEDQNVGFEISVSTNTSKKDLNTLLSEVREHSKDEDENKRFQFYLDDKEVKSSIAEKLDRI